MYVFSAESQLGFLRVEIGVDAPGDVKYLNNIIYNKKFIT